MIRDGEVYIFSTGRKLLASLCEGYDSHIEEGQPPPEEDATAHLRLSAGERRELADYMMREWDQWAKELE